MDIGFETIIYIILGLIFVIAQVAKQKKKKEQAQAAANEDGTEAEPPVGRSVLEQMLGIPENKPIVEKPVENKTPHFVDRDPSFSQPGPSESIGNTVNESLAGYPREKIEATASITNIKSGKQTNFDLKKAVIYKAILERKKF